MADLRPRLEPPVSSAASVADVLAAARSVVARWRDVKRADDEIALLDVALARHDERPALAAAVEGEVPATWYLDMRAERDRLLERLVAAEAYIPSRDFEDYRGDTARLAPEHSDPHGPRHQ